MVRLEFFLTITCAAVVSSVVLKVPGYATIEGTQSTSAYNQRKYFSFHNLPYAKQPTNLTRFMPPVPVEPFPANQTIDGTVISKACLQNHASITMGSEDCLIVDVHSPKLPRKNLDESVKRGKLLPVIYWIHGGSFLSGSNLEYKPQKYMEEDVVLVQVQYRLGPLGFLTLNTDEAPGNAGIFDQIEGLRWVKKYIKYFGGDPDCVTIVGESAGSASVSLLLMAPQARGLFHRAIGESGSVLAAWAFNRDPKEAEETCRKLAKLAGCPLEPYEDLIHCLRNIPARKIVKTFSEIQREDMYNGGTGLSCSNPMIQIAGAQRIIEQDPRDIMESGNYTTDVPVMFGANKQEGVSMLTDLYNGYFIPHNYVNDSEYLKHQGVQRLIKTLKIRDDSGGLADAVISKYLSKAKLGNFTSMVYGLIDFCSVMFIKSAGYETVKLHSQNNPNSYWYSFEFEGQNSLYYLTHQFGNMIPFSGGVSHMDELIYLFEYSFLKPFNRTEKLLSKRMLKLWTTFAKYGNPTPDAVPMDGIPKFWPFDFKHQLYMSIDRKWKIRQDYTKQFTVTIDSQSFGDN